MRSILVLLVVTVLAIVVGGCTKAPGIPDKSTYTFTNANPVRITVDIYGSLDDYAHNTNRISQNTLEAGADQKIVLPAPGKVWVDWYSNGYTLNNWQAQSTGTGAQSSLLAETAVAIEDDHLYLQQQFPDSSRSVLLNGNGTSSTWTVTSTAYPVMGTYTFIFRKDYKCECTFVDQSGNRTENLLNYYVERNTNQAFTIDVEGNGQGSTLATLTFNPFQVLNNSRDTLSVFFQSSGSGYFYAIRQ